MSKISKLVILFTVFVLSLTFTTTGYVQANESEDYPSEAQLNKDRDLVQLSDKELAELHNIINDDTDEPVITPRVAPLIPFLASAVTSLVIKQGGKHLVKKITKHALQRAGQRGITKQQFAHAMRYGQKYTDKKTGAKILYDKSSKTTLVLDKSGKTVVTTYKQKSPKKVWRKGH
ncbi:DUF4258 domain-containing protein [Staphylococcus lentus]|uniref:DUF4258 domain-containing protein n=1 Tax=Mammaliicoccus lentus TaxID=42858 RepID=UPI0018841EE7|nr:DUF4258 domain-containing protein [Mammaliicoccus lentus]MBF0842328.1 DUF4258 domain-containing protein [Mammaliicoccus lentus]MBW0769182.1 DUF4258 domain-containing protein [Mammaliicoccus lentus]